VDWDDPASRESFLTGIIEDGNRLLELASEFRSRYESGSDEDERIASGAQLLSGLLWQDVEPTDRGGYRVRRGTSRDRIPSASDPDQRHGHKSHGKSFTGHKASVAVDVESQLVTSVGVIAGNESDGDTAAELVANSEENTESKATQVIGDTAYGSMAVRKSLGAREVIAPTVKATHGRSISKEDFEIDVESDRVVCPEGHETRHWTWAWFRRSRDKSKERVKRFAFPKELCRACSRYTECVGQDKRRRGRFITLHPDEADLQAARALERTEYFREQYRERVVVEHRIGRLVQLGIRQSRFFGRVKTLFQVMLAATVANLTLVGQAGTPSRPSSKKILADLGVDWPSRVALRRLRGLWQPIWAFRVA
jgi:hypothetical protein